MTDKIFIIFRVPISLCPSSLVDSQHLEEVQGLPTSSWSSTSVTLWCKHQCERWKPQVHSSEAVDALLKSCSVLAGPARMEQASVLPPVILRAFLISFYHSYIDWQKKNEHRSKLGAAPSFHESMILKDSEVELLLLALLTFSVSESMFSSFVQPTNFDIPCKVKV